jgi:hypothetical protein
MPGALQVVIVSQKDNDALVNTVKQLQTSLPVVGRETEHRIAPIKHLDPREPPVACDICIHLGEPYAVWFPWARTNVMIVNGTHWISEKWNGYWSSFDVAVFSSETARTSVLNGSQKPEVTAILEFENAVDYKKQLASLLNTTVEASEGRETLPKHMPPLLNQVDCPPITVITLVHNRPKFIENACLNLLSSDYPRDKIEWLIVDDSAPEQSPSNKIIQFAEKFEPGKISYVPLLEKKSIGYKRNLAVEKAAHNILVMMDDDDHYPSTSFRRRVAYLLKGRRSYGCATCTTIAMYDLMKGTSAVNVPPYSLSLGERCSEASMVFTRDFWRARNFEDTNMAEGEKFIQGRESQVVEMPPQQLIVALSHGSNLSGRKMPDTKPSCFWGFPRPLLEFLHGLVGVKIEEET